MKTYTNLMTAGLNLWCRCGNCDKWFLVPLVSILEGERCTNRGCGANFTFVGANYEQVIHNTLTILSYLSSTVFYADQSKLAEVVNSITEDLWENTQPAQTPKEMGWVDKNNLP